jgi:GAF domain-containing protein
MLAIRDSLTTSDAQRDAERYRQLVRMLRSTTSQISRIEIGGPDIEQILDRLCPDLTEALGAEQSFAAVLRPGPEGTPYFEVTHAYPKHQMLGERIAWRSWLEDLVNTGRAFSQVPFEPANQDPVPGLECFSARSALVVRMQSARDIRIVGVCNEKNPTDGPFLASDCRVLDTLIQLVAIGLRVGERHSLELESIQETSRAVSAELELEKLLNLIVDRAAQVFRAPASSLMLWDEEDNLVIEAAHELTEDYRRQLKIPRAKVEQRRGPDGVYTPLVIDLAQDSLAEPQLVESEGLDQVLTAPLLFSGQLVGVLNIYSKIDPGRPARVFTRQEMELAQIFANQESQKQTAHWKALHEASKVIIEDFAMDRRKLLERMVEEAVNCITGVDGPKAKLAFMQLFDASSNTLSFECIYPPDRRSGLIAWLGDRRVLDRAQSPGGRIGISGRAAHTGRSCLVSDVRSDPDYLEAEISTRSELDVPLISLGKVIGVMSVESDVPNAFDENDQRMLEGLASMAVIAIRNAEQAKELKRSNLVAVMGAWGAEMAHDAKEEVGAIRRAVDILQNRFTLPPAALDWLRQIDVCAEALAMPLLPRDPPAPGQAAALADPANLEDTLASEVERLRHRYQDVTWLTDFEAPDVRVAIHHRWLRQLVRHLGRNAYQALDDEDLHRARKIQVRARSEGNLARIEVEDTGKGVRPEIQPLLFEVPVPHEDERPSGRGLLLVSFLAQQHGGTAMLVSSEVGRGSCFAFTVPMISQENP